MSISEDGTLKAPLIADPHTLGRPVHLLPGFAARFGADVGELLRLGPNRRYGTGFEVAGATIGPSPRTQPPERWMVFGTSAGCIGLSIERPLVLRLLQCRYGLHEAPRADVATLPQTASEERLARKLGQEFATALVQRILDASPGAAERPGPQDDADTPEWLREAGAAPGLWRIAVRIQEPSQGIAGLLCFSLDEGWLRVLLGQLARDRPAVRDADGPHPLASRIKLRLVARLHQQRLPLGDILALRVGDVLPLRLQDADVLVKDSRLFTASVAEHKGRLCLTAFNDI